MRVNAVAHVVSVRSSLSFAIFVSDLVAFLSAVQEASTITGFIISEFRSFSTNAASDSTNGTDRVRRRRDGARIARSTL
ncbi:MAG: hypothetical protein KDD65_03630, partial [Bacteroidetes bacterium]|nr:hypothetical protein [Bacteroidota bacterium]